MTQTLPSNWQWKPGMRASRTLRRSPKSAAIKAYYRVLSVWVASEEDADSYGTVEVGQTYLDVLLEGGEETFFPAEEFTPDFEDAGTQGCLRALAAELCGGSHFHVAATHEKSVVRWQAWACFDGEFRRIGGLAGTYVEALLFSLKGDLICEELGGRRMESNDRQLLQSQYNSVYTDLVQENHFGPNVQTEEDRRRVACSVLALGLQGSFLDLEDAPSAEHIYEVLFGGIEPKGKQTDGV